MDTPFEALQTHALCVLSIINYNNPSTLYRNNWQLFKMQKYLFPVLLLYNIFVIYRRRGKYIDETQKTHPWPTHIDWCLQRVPTDNSCARACALEKKVNG